MSLFVNIAAIIMSVIALAVSSVIALRQARTMHHANQLLLVLDMFQGFRTSEFYAHERYMLNEHGAECPPELGYSLLPDDAKEHFQVIASYYTSIGILVNFDLVEEDLAIASFGYRMLRTWDVLALYTHRERELRQDVYAEYFEDFASRALARPPELIIGERKLRRLRADQRPRSAAPEISEARAKPDATVRLTDG